MAIDFNKPACISPTQATEFGICDDPPPDENPAYLDFTNCEKWIAWVSNDFGRLISFTAIDHCIEIDEAEGERCDGMLQYEETMIFVELKDRDSGRWLGKARDQLKNTIDLYEAEVGFDGYNRFYAYVANKQRPYFNAANPVLAEQFEDDTNFILIVDPVIIIP
jgi:hypothetical protein